MNWEAEKVRFYEGPTLPRTHLPAQLVEALQLLDRVKSGEPVPLAVVNSALRLTGDLEGS